MRLFLYFWFYIICNTKLTKTEQNRRVATKRAILILKTVVHNIGSKKQWRYKGYSHCLFLFCRRLLSFNVILIYISYIFMSLIVANNINFVVFKSVYSNSWYTNITNELRQKGQCRSHEPYFIEKDTDKHGDKSRIQVLLTLLSLFRCNYQSFHFVFIHILFVFMSLDVTDNMKCACFCIFDSNHL